MVHNEEVIDFLKGPNDFGLSEDIPDSRPMSEPAISEPGDAISTYLRISDAISSLNLSSSSTGTGSPRSQDQDLSKHNNPPEIKPVDILGDASLTNQKSPTEIFRVAQIMSLHNHPAHHLTTFHPWETELPPRFFAWVGQRPNSMSTHTLSVPSHLLFFVNPYQTVPPSYTLPDPHAKHATETYDCSIEVPMPGTPFGMTNRFESPIPLSAWYLSTLYLDQRPQAQEASLLTVTLPKDSTQGITVYSAEVGQNWWERILGSEDSEWSPFLFIRCSLDGLCFHLYTSPLLILEISLLPCCTDIRRYSITQAFFAHAQLPSPSASSSEQPRLSYAELSHLQNTTPLSVMIIRFELPNSH